MSKQTFCNEPSDCQWLLETHLKDKNLNNGPVPPFKSFCLMGNEDCPQEIFLYREQHPTVSDQPVRFSLCDNMCYSSFNLPKP